MTRPALLELLLVAIEPELRAAGLRIVPVVRTTPTRPDDQAKEEDDDLERFEADDNWRAARCV